MIRRTFKFMDRVIFSLLFKSRVRPILEYGNTIWSPRFKKDSDEIERVQRRATKMVPGLSKMPYEDRLKILKLPSLKYRRERGDMIETYKYLRNIYKTNLPSLQVDDTSHLRGHNMKLVKKRSNSDLRKHCFSNRIVNKWNSLPNYVVQVELLNSFKARLDKTWENHMYLV